MCHSGHCVEGYCCDAACTGTCSTCRAAGHLGECIGRGLTITTPVPLEVSGADDVGSDSACIAWSGSEFAVGWVDRSAAEAAAHLRRLSDAGALLGADSIVPGISSNPEVMWLEGHWILAGRAPQTIPQSYAERFQTFSSGGSASGAAVDGTGPLAGGLDRFSHYEPYPEVLWNPVRREFAAVLVNQGQRQLFRMDPVGNPAGSRSGDFQAAAVTAAGAEGGYALLRRSVGGGLELALTTATGDAVGSPVPVLVGAEASDRGTAIAWSGQEIAASWTANGAIVFQRFSPTLEALGAAEGVAGVGTGNGTRVHLSWTGADWVLSWTTTSGGTIHAWTEIISEAGHAGPAARLSTSAVLGSPRVVGSVPGGLGAVWDDQRDGHSEVYFSRLTCN